VRTALSRIDCQLQAGQLMRAGGILPGSWPPGFSSVTCLVSGPDLLIYRHCG
jgi:hypothetical protein